MRQALLLILTAALSSPVAAADEALPIRRGEWKMSTRVSVSVAPRPRLRESTQCINRDTLASDQLTGRSGLCDNQEVRVSGNTMTWKVACHGQMEGNSGEGSVTLEGDSLSGRMVLRGLPRQDGERVEVTTTWQGERLGDCE